MKLIRSLFALFACFASVSAVFAQRPKADSEGRVPFVDRIAVSDYLAVQTMFPEPYSRSNDMVILQTVDGLPYRSVILKKTKEGAEKFFVQLWSQDNTLPTDPVELEPEVAQQVLRAFELKLYRFVLMGIGAHEAKGRHEAWWLFHRNRDSMASAGLLIQEALSDNPEADAFLKKYVEGLVAYASAPESKRSELTLELDKAATEIVLRNAPQ